MTGVVADSHAILWYPQGSDRLSAGAASALAEAETGDGIVVSVATLIDLWYVTQTTEGVTSEDLSRLRAILADSSSVDLHPIDIPIGDAMTSISRAVLADPWDRFIVATFMVLEVPLVTRGGAITKSALVDTAW